jgi:hypothetical protein
MQKISDRLNADSKIWFGPLYGDQIFSEFVNSEISDLLSELAHENMDFALLLEIQHHLAKRWAEIAPSDHNKSILLSLSDWSKPNEFLRDVWFCTQREYCLNKGFMTNAEYALMEQDWLTVGYLFRQNPAALLAPLLMHNKLV